MLGNFLNNKQSIYDNKVLIFFCFTNVCFACNKKLILFSFSLTLEELKIDQIDKLYV